MLKLPKCYFLILQVERLAETKVATQQFHMYAVERYSELQQLKRQYGDPLIKSLGETTEQVNEVLRSYIVLQHDVLTGKTEETEKKLDNTLKQLKSRQRVNDLV